MRLGIKKEDYTIVRMGEDSFGNGDWAPVLIGRLTSATGTVYPSREEAEKALARMLLTTHSADRCSKMPMFGRGAW